MDAIDLSTMDLESIKTLYNKNISLLQEKLLNGADWSETNNLRLFVAELGKAVDKKVQQSGSVFDSELFQTKKEESL